MSGRLPNTRAEYPGRGRSPRSRRTGKTSRSQRYEMVTGPTTWGRRLRPLLKRSAGVAVRSNQIITFVLLLAPSLGAQTFSGSGTYIVGVDIDAGTYRSGVGPNGSCYWARLSGLSVNLNEIITHQMIRGGSAVVEIKRSDYAFETQHCAEWHRIDGGESVVRYQREADAGDDHRSSTSSGNTQSLTERERELRDAMMRTAGLNAAGDRFEGLNLKQKPQWPRDYDRAVNEGFLAVSLSSGVARSWGRPGCDTRRTGLRVLYRGWKSNSALICKDGIARTQTTGVGVAEFEPPRMRSPGISGLLQASEGSFTITNPAGCKWSLVR